MTKFSIEDLVTSKETLSSWMARHPDVSPKVAAHWLYPKPFVLKRLWLRFFIKRGLLYNRSEDVSDDELDRACKSGRWGGQTRPSRLFLKVRCRRGHPRNMDFKHRRG
jgi:hypothetical protein